MGFWLTLKRSLTRFYTNVVARSRYSHPVGEESNYDVLIVNVAEAPEHAALVKELHARLVTRNGRCLAKNPNKPRLRGAA